MRSQAYREASGKGDQRGHITWVQRKLLKIHESYVYAAKPVMESGGTDSIPEMLWSLERSNQGSERGAATALQE